MSLSNKRRKLSNGSFEPLKESGSPNTTSQETQRNSLFVRSLPASVTTERLSEHFSQSHPLKHAVVVLDPKTKISKGFGFVTFTDAEDAQAAAELYNNSKLDGRIIKVELAESRHRDVEDGGKSGVNTKAIELRAQREKQRAEAQPPRLIVRNLPWSIKEPEDLAALFRSFGKVKHAVVPKKSGKAQYGFGIVVLRGKKNAEKAIEGVNGKEVDGRTLAVDWAVDKKTWEELQQQEVNEVNGAEKSDKADIIVGDVDQGEEVTEILPDIEMVDGADDSDVDDDDNNSSTFEEEEDAGDLDSNGDNESIHSSPQDDSKNNTVFIRNVPFTTDDEILKEHFQQFGAVRYARVVYDHETERSRGTGFVCFFNEVDAKECVKNAPIHETPALNSSNDKKRKGEQITHSVLQNEASDPSGKYTLEGRVLQVSRALSKSDADQRATAASEKRDIRDRDKRRLYLLSEGTISKSSKLYDVLGKAEIDLREASAKQRQKIVKSSPNLGLSLTRLSVRNIPRNMNSKDLKALAREAVVGFAKDVKEGLREPISKEEKSRGEEAMAEAERRRKAKGVGIVKQAKIVFEGREGGKVKEGGGGRSRGYGFIEYVTHRSALAGLRWLNGHMVKSSDGTGERGKRLIVEFAIENAQVVQRRNEREKKGTFSGPSKEQRQGKKRKLEEVEKKGKMSKPKQSEKKPTEVNEKDRNRIAKRNRVIARKRQARRTRKG